MTDPISARLRSSLFKSPITAEAADHIDDQDAKIKALVEAIQDAIDANPTELNLGNYHHDDVCKLQDEAIAVYYILNAALAAAKEPT